MVAARICAFARRIPAKQQRAYSITTLRCQLSSSRTTSQTAPLLTVRARPSLPVVSVSQTRTFRSATQNLSSSKFNYYISASYSAKDERYNPQTHTFSFNPHNTIYRKRKDPRTRPKSGQDAFFVATVGETDSVAFGVADGVGGWADSGVDPADFSHGFCDFMAWAAHKWDSSGSTKNSLPSAREVMQIGYDNVLTDGSIPAGGSTACVGILKSAGEVEIANLGDSGFVQLRLGAVHRATEAQTHAFNTPFQLSVIPAAQRAKTAAFGGVQLQDYPRDANVSRHDVRHGDILILATDGVWDNLTSSDVLRIVSRLMMGCQAWNVTENGIKVSDQLEDYTMPDDQKNSASAIASLQSYLAVGIASEAKTASVNTRRDGPFAKEVQRWYPGENWRGGKVDDICVVVAVVIEEGR